MSESLEKYGITLVLGGLVLLIVSYVWILLRARHKQVRGRILFMGFPPAAPIYAAFHPRSFAGPLALFLVGLTLAGSPYLINAVAPYFISLGERARQVDGEYHLTLTGWERQDYAGALRAYANASVVQMANADVNDATLAPLANMPNLRELDLSHSGVTDAGLQTVAQLKKLEILRLSHTGVTDAGLNQYVVPLETLKQLDVRSTAVSAEALAAWRAARPGRRGLR